MVIPARVCWRGPFSKTARKTASKTGLQGRWGEWVVVSGEVPSAAPLVVLQQPIQRRAPLIGERETSVGTRDKTLFKQGDDAPGVGPFGVRLDVEEHHAFCGCEAVRRYGLRTRV